MWQILFFFLNILELYSAPRKGWSPGASLPIRSHAHAPALGLQGLQFHRTYLAGSHVTPKTVASDYGKLETDRMHTQSKLTPLLRLSKDSASHYNFLTHFHLKLKQSVPTGENVFSNPGGNLTHPRRSFMWPINWRGSLQEDGRVYDRERCLAFPLQQVSAHLTTSGNHATTTLGHGSLLTQGLFSTWSVSYPRH